MASAANAGTAPRVTLDAGTIEGVAEGRVESFKGIPFTAPPVGEWRWRAPRPVPPWSGVRSATQFGADPMQSPFAEDMAPLRTQPAEDCLFLNVWKPAASSAGAGLPVVAWIYGGGFVNGGTSPAVYEGDAFALQDVVFVSFNYRVGHFGFFAHPALSGADADGGLLGNYGHMDQIAALRWVQRNIAAFGGDPGNVTLIGESAGGGSVVGLMASPEAAGLFHKAVVMSGGGRGLLDRDRPVSGGTPQLPSGETLGLCLAQRHGIEGSGPDALASLRALPAEALAQGLHIPTLDRSRDIFSGQMIDGRVLIDQAAAIPAGRWPKMPLLVGTTAIEVGKLSAGSKREAFAEFGADRAAAAAAYDPDGRASLEHINALIGMDRKMHEPARHLASVAREQGVPCWLYRFSHVAAPMRASWAAGAPHASDIPYFLGRLGATEYGASADAAARETERIAHRYIVNFARHGDPNGAGLPAWDGFVPGSGRLLDFAADGAPRMAADPLTPRLDVVARRAEAQ